jgi:hypothetical protein
MNKIQSVKVDDDLVEVVYLIGETEEIARKHITGYEHMTNEEKKDIWNTIVGNPKIEYIIKTPWYKKLYLKLKK